MDTRRSQVPLQRYFAGLAEYTFHTRLGVVDTDLIDYLARLLARFISTSEIYRLRGLTGQRLDEVGQMLSEAEQRLGDARREVHRHIGDFTLFWAGVYPEALERLRAPSRVDALLDYRQQGKRAYLIASSIETEDSPPANTVLERLAREFDLCAYGLGEVRREWERRDPDDPHAGRLLLE